MHANAAAAAARYTIRIIIIYNNNNNSEISIVILICKWICKRLVHLMSSTTGLTDKIRETPPPPPPPCCSACARLPGRRRTHAAHTLVAGAGLAARATARVTVGRDRSRGSDAIVCRSQRPRSRARAKTATVPGKASGCASDKAFDTKVVSRFRGSRVRRVVVVVVVLPVSRFSPAPVRRTVAKTEDGRTAAAFRAD